MTGQHDLVPGVIIAGTALYSGAKFGIFIGLLIYPPAAFIVGCVSALGAQHLAMRRFEETETPYIDAGKALVSLGIHMLPNTLPDPTVLTEPLPDLSSLPGAYPLPAPLLELAPLRRASLLERIAAASEARATS